MPWEAENRYEFGDSRLPASLGKESPKMKKKKNRGTPLRSFPWSGNAEKTDGQLLIESTVGEWYAAKHRVPGGEEISFVNSIKIASCPYCGSARFVRDGLPDSGLARYRCRSCGKRFNPLTRTIFEGRKIPISEWIEYLIHLFQFHSVKSSAFSNRNDGKTGRYWLSKIFAVLGGIQDGIVLGGTVFIDETYVPVPEGEASKSGDKLLGGISRNQLCIATAANESSSVLVASGTGKISKARVLKAYGKHIEEGSALVHDGEKSHRILISQLKLSSSVHPSSETKGMKDDLNPLNRVNRIHGLVQLFLASHGGYDRGNLQDWLNLFWFIMNGPSDLYGKVLAFIELAVSTRKTLKYRDVFAKKGD